MSRISSPAGSVWLPSGAGSGLRRLAPAQKCRPVAAHHHDPGVRVVAGALPGPLELDVERAVVDVERLAVEGDDRDGVLGLVGDEARRLGVRHQTSAGARNVSRLSRMMRRWSSSEKRDSWASTYCDGIGEALAVGEVGAEHDRLDADLGDDPLHVLLGVRGDDEVLAEDLATGAGRAGRSRPTSPCGPSGTRGPSCACVYGTHTVPISDRHTLMFGKRPKKLCRISAGGELHARDGRPSTSSTGRRRSRRRRVSGSSDQSAPYFW